MRRTYPAGYTILSERGTYVFHDEIDYGEEWNNPATQKISLNGEQITEVDEVLRYYFGYYQSVIDKTRFDLNFFKSAENRLNIGDYLQFTPYDSIPSVVRVKLIDWGGFWGDTYRNSLRQTLRFTFKPKEYSMVKMDKAAGEKQFALELLKHSR